MTQNRISPVSFQGNARFHLALSVSNLDRAISFYERIWNQPPVKIKPGYAKFEVKEPALNFTLNQSQKGATGGALSHMGIQLKDTDSLSAIRARLNDLGLLEELGTSCCYALQDKFWVKDPDGNDIEFFVVLEKDAQPIPVSGKEACCVS